MMPGPEHARDSVSEDGRLDRHLAGEADLRLDLDRERRTGDPEVVYGAGKSPAQIADALRQPHGYINVRWSDEINRGHFGRHARKDQTP